MLTREGLWRRIGSPDAWALPWAMAAACALPWLLPEDWDGGIPGPVQALAWIAVLASGPLLRTRWRVLPLALALAWGTAGHLAQRARWERSLPLGRTRVEGVISAPWTTLGQRREGLLLATGPPPIKHLQVPVFLPSEGEPAPPPGTPVRVLAELRAQDPAPAFLPERPLWRARSDGAPRRIQLASALELEVLGPPPALPPPGLEGLGAPALRRPAPSPRSGPGSLGGPGPGPAGGP